VDRDRFSPSDNFEETAAAVPLQPGELILAEADGVVLGWQARTILIWWLPGIVFIALAWLETRSVVVTAGLAAFCIGLFLFYASDREVRPRGRRRRYVLTDQRLLIAAAGEPPEWRPLDLADVASTLMEEGIADRAVRRGLDRRSAGLAADGEGQRHLDDSGVLQEDPTDQRVGAGGRRSGDRACAPLDSEVELFTRLHRPAGPLRAGQTELTLTLAGENLHSRWRQVCPARPADEPEQQLDGVPGGRARWVGQQRDCRTVAADNRLPCGFWKRRIRGD